MRLYQPPLVLPMLVPSHAYIPLWDLTPRAAYQNKFIFLKKIPSTYSSLVPKVHRVSLLFSLLYLCFTLAWARGEV